MRIQTFSGMLVKIESNGKQRPQCLQLLNILSRRSTTIKTSGQMLQMYLMHKMEDLKVFGQTVLTKELQDQEMSIRVIVVKRSFSTWVTFCCDVSLCSFFFRFLQSWMTIHAKMTKHSKISRWRNLKKEISCLDKRFCSWKIVWWKKVCVICILSRLFLSEKLSREEEKGDEMAVFCMNDSRVTIVTQVTQCALHLGIQI